ncbi:hypothetical protein L6R53_24000 [Myxococcota bacterium]|nr:hypothetical protein [Myxococcota bacterium]
MTGGARALPDSAFPARGIAALLEPRVVAARRLLAQQRYPVVDRAALRGSGDSAALLEALLQPQDFPLESLRQALSATSARLRHGDPDPLEPALASLLPGSLEGDDPASRAARRVYRILRERARRQGIPRGLAREEAKARALEFLELCRARLPAPERGGVARVAAMHAWAQCYAREFADAPFPCAPSAACEDAALLAERIVKRLLPT